MAAKNDITGDSISTKRVTNAYRDNWDRIFKKKTSKKKKAAPQQEEVALK